MTDSSGFVERRGKVAVGEATPQPERRPDQGPPRNMQERITDLVRLREEVDAVLLQHLQVLKSNAALGEEVERMRGRIEALMAAKPAEGEP